MSAAKVATVRALRRLESAGALPTLVRGALPPAVLQQLLADALPEQARYELPAEVWAGLAAGIAAESDPFAQLLAERIDDHLAWESEPLQLDDWWPVVRERPLEALWMAACSEQRPVRDEFDHLARHCVENFRASPADAPPSWEFLEGVLGVQARTLEQLRASERATADAERRARSARQRLEALRAELKRLRRENAELRASRTTSQPDAGRTPLAAEDELQAQRERVRSLESRLRKADKEREHLRRRLEQHPPQPPGAGAGAPSEAAPASREPGGPGPDAAPAPGRSARLEEPSEPRERLLLFILHKLIAKGKIGASHTHEDNIYRGVPDHEKGLAKRLVERLYKEGFLIPKPTASDPHLSLAPERLREVRAILDGRVTAPDLLRPLRASRDSASSHRRRRSAS